MCHAHSVMCHLLSRCVAATPLAPDYQRYLEPIQSVDVERLPRLPVANEMGRVGRQVCFKPESGTGIFLTCALSTVHCAL